MGRHDVIYNFEHKVLPDLTFDCKEAFLVKVMEEKNALYRLLSGMLDEEGISNTYSEDDIKRELFKKNDVYTLVIDFPKPEKAGHCYYCCILFDEDCNNIMYFCVERGGWYSMGRPFLGGWLPGMHLNYGECTLEKSETIDKCIEIYLG